MSNMCTAKMLQKKCKEQGESREGGAEEREREPAE